MLSRDVVVRAVVVKTCCSGMPLLRDVIVQRLCCSEMLFRDVAAQRRLELENVERWGGS